METRVLRSALLREAGFPHGFSLRTGGVSDEPFDSLNLGRAVGDEPARVAENHRRFAEAVGFERGLLYELSQVHGRHVHVVGPRDEPVALRAEQGDALVATRPGVAVGVRVADCMPLLLADPTTGAVAAVHAGWRGMVAGVIAAALDAMCRSGGASPARLRAAIFPHIRQRAFEVGEDVARTLQGAAPGRDVVDWTFPKPRVALATIAREQLRSAGVLDAHVEDVPGCTYADSERFFSYRRDGARSGRHVAAIVAGAVG